MWDKYFTSSIQVKHLINTYGKDSFTVKVCKIFKTVEQAHEWESKAIQRTIKNELCLNGHFKGNLFNAGLIHVNNGKINKLVKPDNIPEGFETGRLYNLQKSIKITNGLDIANIYPGDEVPTGWYKGCPAAHNKNKMTITNGSQQKYIDIASEIPKGWTKGVVKNRVNNHNKNKIWITDGNNSKMIAGDIPDGWYRGRTRKGKNEL